MYSCTREQNICISPQKDAKLLPWIATWRQRPLWSKLGIKSVKCDFHNKFYKFLPYLINLCIFMFHFIYSFFIHSFIFLFYFTGGSTLKVFCLCKTLWKHCICMAMNGYVIASYNRFVNGSLKRNCSIDRHSAWSLPGSMAKCGTRYRNKILPANLK